MNRQPDANQVPCLRRDEFSIHQFVYSTGKLGIKGEQVDAGGACYG